MKKFEEFLNRNWRKVELLILLAIFFNTCGNPNRSTNKRLDALTSEIDSLKTISATKKDLQIEGLKSEKRMIQSTDRKILDVNRQSEIDTELKKITSEP